MREVRSCGEGVRIPPCGVLARVSSQFPDAVMTLAFRNSFTSSKGRLT
jgi:hypothetical protein